MSIAIVLGTRPEIIKMASIIRECEKRKIPYFVLHTGQHYSKELDENIFFDLELPAPRYNLKIGSGKPGEQIGKMIIEIEKILIEEKPEIVLVQGDTNSVLAGAIAASKNSIKVGHVEAGLRSFDRTMPEEQNRIIADHISDVLFPPTNNSRATLFKEGLEGSRIHVVGNTIVDAVMQNIELAEKKSKILSKLSIQPKKYILATTHRAENVDNPEKLQNILAGLSKISLETGCPIIFPIHPRTTNKIAQFKISVDPSLNLIPPAGFLEFLQLEKNALLILTDSGGVQEEACILGVPCVTLRENTERPETVDLGVNIVAGTNVNKMLDSARTMLSKKFNQKNLNPYGDGLSGQRIVDICQNFITSAIKTNHEF